MSVPNSVPTRVFIVPYRNRPEQKFFFSQYMNFLLENTNDYEIYFSHQCDERSFNRGAVKNVGFLAMKEKYPNDYKDITFIFHDVDTVPFHRIFDYQTTKGVVKHYYGFDHSLGGIVVIQGEDFEKEVMSTGLPSKSRNMTEGNACFSVSAALEVGQKNPNMVRMDNIRILFFMIFLNNQMECQILLKVPS
jgi:hypothetical protein